MNNLQITEEQRYLSNLGKLMSNFWALEFILRVFLCELHKSQASDNPSKTDIRTFPFGSELPEINIYSFPVHSELPINYLTNYFSLTKLITDFNNEMKTRQLPEIDPTLIEIRDAIAHGRVSSLGKNGPMCLLKFGPPKDDKVHLVFKETLSREWFQRQLERTNKACQLILNIRL